MKKFFSCLLSFGILASVIAQEDPVAKKYSRYIDTVTASKHLTILASDAFEGRETGTQGAAKAANYLSEELKKLGLKAPVNNSFYQDVDLIESSLSFNRFEVNGSQLEYLQDFYLKTLDKPYAINSSDIVFVGYGISASGYDDLKGLDIKGKVVLLLGQGEPVKNRTYILTGSTEASEWSKSLTKRFDLLKSKDPALILSVNEELKGLLSSNKGHVGQPTMSIKRNKSAVAPSAAPVIHLTPEATNLFLKKSGTTIEQLKNKINSSGKPSSQSFKASFNASFSPVVKDIEAVNVLGYLEGSDLKDELVVISAHYDHVGLNPDGVDKVFNGADDDGSGTTAVLELAEAFTQAKKEGKGPRRSLLFLFVVGEEKGLLGSEWYSDHPVFPLKNTVTNLNIDMIGRVDPSHKNSPDYCYLIGSDKLSTDLHKISEKANATYTDLKIDYKYNDPNDPERIYYRSDHYNFAKHNIPIIFYFNGVHEDYHQPGDEVSKINFPLLVKRAHLIYFTAWDLVNRDKRPVVDVK